MAKKKILTVVKIQIEAGKASPAPPVGTALGPHGIAIMDFVKAYNARTEAQAGTVIPTEITIYEDRTFDFVLKTPPTAVLVREKAGLAKAANNPGSEIAGSITEAQLEEIAEVMRCPVGTVRSRIFRAREAIDHEILPLIEGN